MNAASFRPVPSKRMLNPKPELRRRVGPDRLGDVEADHGAFDEADPGDVEAEAHADGVGDGALGLSVYPHVAGVVEGGEVDVAQADEVVTAVPAEVAGEGNAPFDAGDPAHVALALLQVEAAEVVAAAQ